MSNEYFDYEDEFEMESFDSKKLSICFCLDTSGSMVQSMEQGAKTKIDVMMESFRLIFDGIRAQDDIASFADISVITFGGSVKTLLDFDSINNQSFPATPTPFGATPLPSAILKASKSIMDRVDGFKKKGVKIYMPWLIILTDGQSTEGHINKKARETLKKLNTPKDKLLVITIAVGDESDVDIDYLNEISNIGECIQAKKTSEITEIFQSLLQSYTFSVQSGKDSKEILKENFKKYNK